MNEEFYQTIRRLLNGMVLSEIDIDLLASTNFDTLCIDLASVERIDITLIKQCIENEKCSNLIKPTIEAAAKRLKKPEVKPIIFQNIQRVLNSIKKSTNQEKGPTR